MYGEWNPESRILKFYQAKIPVIRKDISNGSFSKLVQYLAEYPKFREMNTNALLDNISFAFGYQNYFDLLHNVPDSFDKSSFPNQEWQFPELIAWRLYLGKRCGLSDALGPVSVTWDATPFEAKNAFTWDGWLENEEDEDLQRLGFSSAIDWRIHLHDVTPFFLSQNEPLFCTARYEMSHLVAENYFHPGCGVSAEKLADDLEMEAILPLEDALQIHGSALNPPGLTFHTYYDMNGILIGYGFSCQAIRGYLKDVFLDKESLSNATAALWRCEPVEQWAAKELPETIFAGEFRAPWRPSRSKGKKYPEEQMERDQLAEEILHSLPTCNGKINLGYDVILAGETYTRAPTQVAMKEIAGLLGLRLLRASDVPENYCGWLLELIPYALDLATYECLCRTSLTFNGLKDKELDWVRNQDAHVIVHRLARLSSAHAMPICSYGAEVQRRWEGRRMDFAVASADAVIRSIYPALNMVKKPYLGEYALDYFGKDEIYEGMGNDCNIEFLQYAVLRNLGLDPLYYLPERTKEWLVIFRLTRLCLMDVDDKDFGAAAKRVAIDARALLLKSGKLLRLFEELDTSFDTSRITVHKHLSARQEK